MSEQAGSSPRSRPRSRGRVRSIPLLLLLTLLFMIPATPAYAWNPFCEQDTPTPTVAGTGVDGLFGNPSNPGAGDPSDTAYERYGMSGLQWHAIEVGCGTHAMNTGANLLLQGAFFLDKLTIASYEAAFSDSLLDSLANQTAGVIGALSNAIYFPYLTPLILIGAMWAAWHGLVRRRATMTAEGTIWMVVAIVAALWLFNRPAQLIGFGSEFVTQASNASMNAIARLNPSEKGSCFGQPGSRTIPSGTDQAVDRAANTLWIALACRPWLAGEFGTDRPGSQLVKTQGPKLLAAQEFTIEETDQANLQALGEQKQRDWEQVQSEIKNDHSEIYPLFQGAEPGSRFGIAVAAMAAAVFCGLLILIASVALLVFKIAFLLLLMVGPVFLLIGIHPGTGRVVAIRWFEMLVGMLIKQIMVAIALSIILLAYVVILNPASPLPWGMQILLVALVAVAVFLLRRPFQDVVGRSAAAVGVGGGRSAGTSTDRERPAPEAGFEEPDAREGAASRALGATWRRHVPQQGRVGDRTRTRDWRRARRGIGAASSRGREVATAAEGPRSGRTGGPGGPEGTRRPEGVGSSTGSIGSSGGSTDGAGPAGRGDAAGRGGVAGRGDAAGRSGGAGPAGGAGRSWAESPRGSAPGRGSSSRGPDSGPLPLWSRPRRPDSAPPLPFWLRGSREGDDDRT